MKLESPSADPHSFLGRGWSFPPTFDVESGVVMTTNEEDIRQSIRIILLTGAGERVMRPHFGAGLLQHMFEPIDATLQTKFADDLKNALLREEPRIVVEDVALRLSPDQTGALLITVHYFIPTTNSRSNVVIPFAQQEGTLIP